METDYSGFTLGGILAQEDQEGRRYVVAFHSQRLDAAEYNYPIYNKEILAIIRYLTI